MSMTIINKNNIDIINGEKPVLVEFQAPWCTYCRRIEPVLDRISSSRDDIIVGKINIDNDPELAEKYKIELVPTLMLFKKGQYGNTIVAPSSKAQIDEFIAQEL